MTEQIQNTLSLITNSGLNAIAAECLRLVEEEQGRKIYDARDLLLLLVVRCMGALHQREQFGRMLCAALAFGAAVGYDIELALRDAIRRDAERAGDGDQAAGTKPDAAACQAAGLTGGGGDE